jgi:hypothetical protein
MSSPYLPTEDLIDQWMSEWVKYRTSVDPIVFVARRAAIWGCQQQYRRMQEPDQDD